MQPGSTGHSEAVGQLEPGGQHDAALPSPQSCKQRKVRDGTDDAAYFMSNDARKYIPVLSLPGFLAMCMPGENAHRVFRLRAARL